jgi:hypothetical protein
MDDITYAVTLVKVGPGLPVFEIGAYTYTGRWLPQVGDTISIRPVSARDGEAPEDLQGYVTRINPTSNSPISVLAVASDATEASSTDDYLVGPAGDHAQREWRRAEGL